jgi:uncharacterized protein YjbJ (UPF0337 family)
MGQRPEELRADIEARRQDMGVTLDAIGDRVSPGQIASRRKAMVRQRVTGWREAVMGSPDYVRPTPHGSSSGSNGGLQSKVSDLGDKVSGIGDQVSPDAMRQKAAGNPLAAGLIAFGAGLLVASVLPESKTESEVVDHLQPQLEAAASDAAEAGQQVAQAAKSSASDAGQQLKETATDAAQEVKQQASGAVDEVKGHAQDAAQNVQDTAKGDTSSPSGSNGA